MRRRVRHPSLRALAALLVLSATVVLVACGGDDDDSASDKVPKLTAQNGKVTVTAHDIYFNTKEIDSTAGPLEVTFENKGAQLHDFKIDDPEFKVAADPGKTASKTVTLKPGTYAFYCDVPGHRAQGINGTLVVK
jgi:uncharacterized cupredoxin-like copper-binding protein